MGVKKWFAKVIVFLHRVRRTGVLADCLIVFVSRDVAVKRLNQMIPPAAAAARR